MRIVPIKKARRIPVSSSSALKTDCEIPAASRSAAGRHDAVGYSSLHQQGEVLAGRGLSADAVIDDLDVAPRADMAGEALHSGWSGRGPAPRNVVIPDRRRHIPAVGRKALKRTSTPLCGVYAFALVGRLRRRSLLRRSGRPLRFSLLLLLLVAGEGGTRLPQQGRLPVGGKIAGGGASALLLPGSDHLA